jgi:Zn-dependent peptidase ImmA (M78 family)/DNA-binding XRE family transcriptional regulator
MTDGARVAVGNRIRARREELGLSQAALAERLNRTQTSISYWEAGQRSPDVEDLVALADALDLEPGDLLTDAPVTSPRVLFRAEVARLELDEFADAMDDFIEAAEDLKPPRVKFTLTARDPVRAAQELSALADRKRPPIDVEGIARACGLRVLGYDFGDEAPVSGFLIELESGPVIGFNKGQFSHGRQRFTIAHELAHYLLRHHDNFHIDVASAVAHGEAPNYDWRDERAANEFAAELLMPAPLVLGAAQRVKSVRDLARLFEVSQEAMGFRLINLGLR